MRRLHMAVSFAALFAGRLCAGPIEWSGTMDIDIGGPGYGLSYYTVDMNDDGGGDFYFARDIVLFHQVFDVRPLNGNQTAVTPDGGGFESNPLSFGEEIGSVLPSPFEWDSSDYTLRKWLHVDEEGRGGPSTQEWPGHGESGYMGVSFDVGGEVHYGWIHLTVGEHEDPSYAGMIHSWAWNTTPGQSIWAGQVPEPSTYILFALGGLTIAFAARRQIRKKE